MARTPAIGQPFRERLRREPCVGDKAVIVPPICVLFGGAEGRLAFNVAEKADFLPGFLTLQAGDSCRSSHPRLIPSDAPSFFSLTRCLVTGMC